MLRRSLFMCRFLFSDVKLKMDKFSHDEVRKMCELLKTKYFKFNEDLQIFRDVRLLDEKGKLIGIYTPTQAYKKAEQTGKDLVVMNEQSTPIVAKLMHFKSDIVQRFYNDLVLKNRDTLLSKNNRVKRLKLTANMSNNDMKIKMMQILEIIKKQSKVMLFMRTSRAFDDEKVTQKMESIKAQLGQRVRIIQDIKVRTEEEEEEGDDQKPQKKKPEEEQLQEEEEEDDEPEPEVRGRPKTYSIVVESSKDELKNKIQGMLKDNPEDAIKKFLKKYELQEDEEMKELAYDISMTKKDFTEEGEIKDKSVVEGGGTKTRKEKFDDLTQGIDKDMDGSRQLETEVVKNMRLSRRIDKLLQ